MKLNHFALYLTLTQDCKSTVSQIKYKLSQNISRSNKFKKSKKMHNSRFRNGIVWGRGIV